MEVRPTRSQFRQQGRLAMSDASWLSRARASACVVAVQDPNEASFAFNNIAASPPWVGCATSGHLPQLPQPAPGFAGYLPFSQSFVLF